MAGLASGRLRTALALDVPLVRTLVRAPAARKRRLRPLVRALVKRRTTRRLIRLMQYLSLRDAYLANMQLAAGCDRRQAFRRGFGPFMRWGQLLDYRMDREAAGDGTVAPPRWLRYIDVRGLDPVLALHAQGRPVIVAVPHLGLSGSVLVRLLAARGVKTAAGILTPNIFRGIPNVEVFDADTPYLGYVALRQGNVLIHGGDAPGPGLPCRFLGHYTSIPLLTARMAKETGAAVVVAHCHELRPGRWEAVLEAPRNIQDCSPEQITVDILNRLEQIIRTYPFEWVAYRPFLSHVGFPDTGRLTVLVAGVGPQTEQAVSRYLRRVAAYAMVEVTAANLDDVDLTTVADTARQGGHDLVLLVRPDLGDDLAEVPALVNWLFRADPDWVAYEPAVPPQDQAAGNQLTPFSLSLVKTAVLEALVAHGLRRLDADALLLAKRAGFRCSRVPREDELLEDVRRLEEGGREITELLL